MSVIDMILHCPECSKRHIDVGDFYDKEHHTHACQYCGLVWRPAIQATKGVRFLPGFKNEEVPKVKFVGHNHIKLTDGSEFKLNEGNWEQVDGNHI